MPTADKRKKKKEEQSKWLGWLVGRERVSRSRENNGDDGKSFSSCLICQKKKEKRNREEEGSSISLFFPFFSLQSTPSLGQGVTCNLPKTRSPMRFSLFWEVGGSLFDLHKIGFSFSQFSPCLTSQKYLAVFAEAAAAAETIKIVCSHITVWERKCPLKFWFRIA